MFNHVISGRFYESQNFFFRLQVKNILSATLKDTVLWCSTRRESFCVALAVTM